MARVLKRESAKRDLIAQWVWYAENASIEIADRFLLATENSLEALAERPGIGVACGFRSTGLETLRRFPVGEGFEKILLFYLPLSDGVDLVRILHGHRDLKTLFEEGLF